MQSPGDAQGGNGNKLIFCAPQMKPDQGIFGESWVGFILLHCTLSTQLWEMEHPGHGAPHCKGKKYMERPHLHRTCRILKKKELQVKRMAHREIQKCQLGSCVLNQSLNEALDWLGVSFPEQLISCSLGMLTLLPARSYKVLAYGRKRSLQVP